MARATPPAKAKSKPERPKPTPAKLKPPRSPEPRTPPSDEVAKLAAAVAAAPDDVELQRIYADALILDGGEHAIRGELVTLALSDKSKKLTEPRRVKLAKQLEAILADDNLEQRVIGGFVGAWTCTPDVFVKRADQVFADEPLLRELEIQLTPEWSATQTAKISFVPGLARVRRLTIVGRHLRSGRLGTSGLSTLLGSRFWPRLEALRLPSCAIGDGGARAIAEARSMRDLLELDLTQNDLTGRGVAMLAKSPHLGEVRRLVLASNQPGRTGALAIALTEHLTKLEHVDLQFAWFAPGDTTELLARFPNALVRNY